MISWLIDNFFFFFFFTYIEPFYKPHIGVWRYSFEIVFWSQLRPLRLLYKSVIFLYIIILCRFFGAVWVSFFNGTKDFLLNDKYIRLNVITSTNSFPFYVFPMWFVCLCVICLYGCKHEVKVEWSGLGKDLLYLEQIQCHLHYCWLGTWPWQKSALNNAIHFTIQWIAVKLNISKHRQCTKTVNKLKYIYTYKALCILKAWLRSMAICVLMHLITSL